MKKICSGKQSMSCRAKNSALIKKKEKKKMIKNIKKKDLYAGHVGGLQRGINKIKTKCQKKFVDMLPKLG